MKDGKNSFFSQATALSSLAYMLSVVFVFIDGDVLFKNFLVYKGGELEREDKKFHSSPFSSSPSSPSKLYILLHFFPIFFCRYYQLVFYSSFLIIFLITRNIVVFFQSHYTKLHITFFVRKGDVLSLPDSEHMVLYDVSLSYFLYVVYFQHNLKHGGVHCLKCEKLCYTTKVWINI